MFDLDRLPRQDRDAVVGLLPDHRDFVAKPRQLQGRELQLAAFDLLQEGNVGIGHAQPVEHIAQPGLDRVHVEGGDLHAMRIAPVLNLSRVVTRAQAGMTELNNERDRSRTIS